MNAPFVKMACLAMGVAIATARAEDGIGLGVIVGEPTGLSAKYWLGAEHAIDAAAAWSFSENDSFQFHMDYLIHKFGILKIDPATGRLPLYFGVGARAKLKHHDNPHGRNEDDALLGIRVPFGIAILFAKAPVELFGEIVPVFDVAPKSDFAVNGAIGARYYLR